MKKILFLIALLLFATPALAVVAVGTTQVEVGDSVNAFSWSQTITGSNTIVVCGAGIFGFYGDGTPTAYTFNAVSLNTISFLDPFTSTLLQYLGYRIVAAGTYSVAITLADISNTVASCTSFTGAHQTTPIGTPQTVVDDPMTGVTLTVPTNGIGYELAGFIGQTFCPTSSSSASGQSAALFTVCSGDGSVQAVASTRTTTGAFTWTTTADQHYFQIAVPISEAAAAPGVFVRHKPVNQ